jgi:hypothetical protein
MRQAADLLEKARTNRELARRARRVAWELKMDADKARVIRYSEELEEEADDLERRAADLAPPKAANIDGAPGQAPEPHQSPSAQLKPKKPETQD